MAIPSLPRAALSHASQNQMGDNAINPTATNILDEFIVRSSQLEGKEKRASSQKSSSPRSLWIGVT